MTKDFMEQLEEAINMAQKDDIDYRKLSMEQTDKIVSKALKNLKRKKLIDFV